MQCQIDDTEMEKGFLSANGAKWTKGHTSLEVLLKFLNSLIPGPIVYAFCCPKCGKVELSSPTK